MPNRSIVTLRGVAVEEIELLLTSPRIKHVGQKLWLYQRGSCPKETDMLIDVSRLGNLLQVSDSPDAPTSDAVQNIFGLQPCPFCLGPGLRLNPLRGFKYNFHAAADVATLKEQLALI